MFSTKGQSTFLFIVKTDRHQDTSPLMDQPTHRDTGEHLHTALKQIPADQQMLRTCCRWQEASDWGNSPCQAPLWPQLKLPALGCNSRVGGVGGKTTRAARSTFRLRTEVLQAGSGGGGGGGEWWEVTKDSPSSPIFTFPDSSHRSMGGVPS